MWIILAILAAFASATRSAISKKLIVGNDEYVTSWALWFFGLPILLLTLAFVGLPHQVTSFFWVVLLINILLNVVATLFFMRALNSAPLSLVAPILALMPVFVTLAALVTLGEVPSLIGWSGILLAVLGTYLLNADQLHSGLLKPLAELFKNIGCRYALLVAALWGITSTLDKVALQNSSPVFYLIGISVGVSLFFAIILKTKGKNSFGLSLSNWKGFLALGTAYGLMLVFQLFSIRTAFVAYALSIKRVDALLGIAFGYFFFKEINIRSRFLGGALILMSLLLIAIA